MSVKNNRNSKNERINKSDIDKKTKKRNPNEPIVIEFNLSKAVAILIAIVVLITSITTAKVVTTIMEGKETKALANEEQDTNTTVTWVESTHKDVDGNTVVDMDSNGNSIKVPVPKGYTASKIGGETSANTGFVIYEGDVDWSTIIVEEAAAETSETLESTTNEVTTTESESTQTTVDETSITEMSIDEETTSNDDITNTEEKTANDIEEDITTQLTEDETTETDDAEALSDTENTNEIAPLADDTTTEETTTTETTTVTQTDINIFNLQKTTNQYVWVPVSDISRIYGVDSNGKLWGKLYNASSRAAYSSSWTETNGIMSISSKTSYREPDVTHSNFSYDIDSKLPGYLNGQTQYELLSKEFEENFYATIKSIKEYGGFYIGRYETGGLNGTAVVRKMDTNIASQTWYTMYKKCKTLSGGKENVATSMIWGCLWDETLEWLYESGATISNGTVLTRSLIASNSTTWGNYKNATFDYIASTSEIPEETENKAVNTSKKIPAGSSDYTKVNNIYDLAGNVWNWTLEAYSADYRVQRGGSYGGYGNSYPSSYRNYNNPTVSSGNLGCRALLLIK